MLHNFRLATEKRKVRRVALFGKMKKLVCSEETALIIISRVIWALERSGFGNIGSELFNFATNVPPQPPPSTAFDHSISDGASGIVSKAQLSRCVGVREPIREFFSETPSKFSNKIKRLNQMWWLLWGRKSRVKGKVIFFPLRSFWPVIPRNCEQHIRHRYLIWAFLRYFSHISTFWGEKIRLGTVNKMWNAHFCPASTGMTGVNERSWCGMRHGVVSLDDIIRGVVSESLINFVYSFCLCNNFRFQRNFR